MQVLFEAAAGDEVYAAYRAAAAAAGGDPDAAQPSRFAAQGGRRQAGRGGWQADAVPWELVRRGIKLAIFNKSVSLL